jgi:murein DD-endopeptidase MepM/ murein hydrolase activator NlpD
VEVSRHLLVVVVAAAGCLGDPHVINGYRSPMGIQGTYRSHAHSGLDFEGEAGDPVLAVADGVVAAQSDSALGAGGCVLLEHHCARCGLAVYYTSYCHLRRSLVTSGQVVVRGQQIAEVGHTGRLSGGVSHLHFAMCRFPCVAGAPDGDFRGTLDPMTFDVGCFDPRRDYREEGRPVLTHPIVCAGR